MIQHFVYYIKRVTSDFMTDPSYIPEIKTEKISVLACPGCEAELDVSEFEVFENIDCPVCQEKITVPGRLGDFLLIEELGRGAMGCVYLAMDETLNRLVALKVIRKEYGEDPKMLESVQREAQAMATLNHRNIVQVYSFGRIEEQPFFVMELLQGERLDVMMENGALVDEIRALEIAIDVAHGLQAADEAGLTHGDIKPANILMNDEGVAKVVDFGLAKFMEPGQEIEVWGTPYYIAPEKAKKEGEDSRSDQYSLGGTIYHALAGHPPFDAESPTKVVVASLKEETPLISESNPDVSEKTDQVIRRMMDKNPNRRYPTYPSLIADLEVAKTRAIEEREAFELEQKRLEEKQNKKNNPLLITMMAVLAVVILGIGVVVMVSSRSGSENVPAYAGPQREPQAPFTRAEERNLNEAVQALQQENLMGMEGNIRVVRRFIPADHVAMGWAKFLEAGMWMYAQYPEKARQLLEEVADMDEMIFDTPRPPEEDPRILAKYILGQLDERDVQRAVKKAQPYYAHLAELALGYERLFSDDRNGAARYFRAYSEFLTPGMDWPYVLAPVAAHLHVPRKQLFGKAEKAEPNMQTENELLPGDIQSVKKEPTVPVTTPTPEDEESVNDTKSEDVSNQPQPLKDTKSVDVSNPPQPSLSFRAPIESEWKNSTVGSAKMIEKSSKTAFKVAPKIQPVADTGFTLALEMHVPERTSDVDVLRQVVVHFGGTYTSDDPVTAPFGLIIEVMQTSSEPTSLVVRAGDGITQTFEDSFAVEEILSEQTYFTLVWDQEEGETSGELRICIGKNVIATVEVKPEWLPDPQKLSAVSIGRGIGNGGLLDWGNGIDVKKTKIYDLALDVEKNDRQLTKVIESFE